MEYFEKCNPAILGLKTIIGWFTKYYWIAAICRIGGCTIRRAVEVIGKFTKYYWIAVICRTGGCTIKAAIKGDLVGPDPSFGKLEGSLYWRDSIGFARLWIPYLLYFRLEFLNPKGYLVDSNVNYIFIINFDCNIIIATFIIVIGYNIVVTCIIIIINCNIIVIIMAITIDSIVIVNKIVVIIAKD